jgi:DNA-binding IclR family transcriptional regulator
VSRGALAVLLWFATESNAWRPFTVTALASREMLNLSRNTISRALKLIRERGYLEERKPANGRPGQREARLLLAVR